MIDPESSKKIVDEASKLAPEVYQDIAKPAAKEIGDVAGRTVKALLAPVRGLLWGWEKIEQVVTEGINKRFEKIPEERRKTPDPEIAVPLMQALTYTAQNETLREMYLNLLANSMDSTMSKITHPSFVEIIKQMSSLDAKVFDKLSQKTGYQKAINPNVEIYGQGKMFIGAMPEWYLGWIIDGYDIFDISASLIRLSKFGLIDLLLDRTAGTDGYTELETAKDLNNILISFQKAKPDMVLVINAHKSVLYINEYGLQFKKACK